MRVKSLQITDYKPIKNIQLDNLSDIAIIAGANGAGKTRLKSAIIASLQSTPLMKITMEATRKEEASPKYFNSQTIIINKGRQNQIFRNYINSRKYGKGKYIGSVVQIDSKKIMDITIDICAVIDNQKK